MFLLEPKFCDFKIFYVLTNYKEFSLILILDLQKLDREARICRLLKHPNIGEQSEVCIVTFSLLTLQWSWF